MFRPLAGLRLSFRANRNRVRPGNLKPAQTNPESHNKTKVELTMRIQQTSEMTTPPCPEPVFSLDDRWYFQTGDGTRVGPFRYRSEAQTGLENFLLQLKNETQFYR